MISIDDFRHDEPWIPADIPQAKVPSPLIDGVSITPMMINRDKRGSLVELKRADTESDEPIVFVYRVTAEAGSIRGWVYHRWQDDRLAYTEGHFQIALYDIRPDSPTYGLLNLIEAGEDNPLSLRIPAYVVHGVKNCGASASFVNMPTKAYDPATPDKSRVAYPDPRIPFTFD